MRVTAVFGISAVGKSWLIGKFVQAHGGTHVGASALLRDAKASKLERAVGNEELRKGSVLENQALLMEAFAAVRHAATQDIIFDGHNVVDSDDALLEIPIEVIRSIGPSNIIVVIDDPSSIAARRSADSTRIRPARSLRELRFHQERAVAIGSDHAEKLAIPFSIVPSGNLNQFVAAMSAGKFSEKPDELSLR